MKNIVMVIIAAIAMLLLPRPIWEARLVWIIWRETVITAIPKWTGYFVITVRMPDGVLILKTEAADLAETPWITGAGAVTVPWITGDEPPTEDSFRGDNI